ncbi:MAG: TRAP transporter small permease [Alphaproteobacteria bacterium]
MLARVHGGLDRGLALVEGAMAIAAGAVVVAIMALVSLDAVLRHVFAEPLTFQIHLTQFYLLVAATMLALPWGYRRGGAIQVRLLLDRLPHRVGEAIVRIGLMASALYLLALAWRARAIFAKAWVDDEVVMGVIDWPVAWSWIWVPLGCAVLAVRLLVDASAPALRPIGAGGHE